MTEILSNIGLNNFTQVLSVLVICIGVCAFFVSLVTEALKSIERINHMPTKLVCYIVALVLTTPLFCAMMAFMKQPIEWYMVFASFLMSFVVAKVSMSGWDDVTELANRLIRKQETW